jgi:hypothetical protein
MFISMGAAIDTRAPTSLTFSPRRIGHARHVNEDVVLAHGDVGAGRAAGALGELVEDRANAERRENVRRDLQMQLAPDRPGLGVGFGPEIDLAAHDHVDELVLRGEPLLLDAERVLRVLVTGDTARALEIAEGGAAPGVEERLDGRVRMLGRVMDLRDVVHGGDAVVELTEPAEQLADVHIFRPVHGRELEQDELVVRGAPARRVRQVVDEDPIREEAAQRRLELVVVRVDEAGHDDAAAGVDHIGAARLQIGADRQDLLALDQHVGVGKVADRGVHRHHRAAPDDVAPAASAGAFRRVPVVRGGRARCEQFGAGRGGGSAGGGRRLQEVAP